MTETTLSGTRPEVLHQQAALPPDPVCITAGYAYITKMYPVLATFPPGPIQKKRWSRNLMPS